MFFDLTWMEADRLTVRLDRLPPFYEPHQGTDFDAQCCALLGNEPGPTCLVENWKQKLTFAQCAVVAAFHLLSHCTNVSKVPT